MKKPSLLLPLAASLAFVLLAACGGSGRDGPEWTSLARGLPLVSAAPALARWHFPAGSAVTITDEGETVRLAAVLPASAWARTATPGVWRAGRPFASALRRTEKIAGELEHPSRELRRFAQALADSTLADLEVGTYTLNSDTVFLRLAADEEPGEGYSFSIGLARAVHDAEGWRPVVGGWVGEGIAAWTGETREVRTAVAPGSALHVGTAVEMLGTAADPTSVVLTIALQGQEILRWSPPAGSVTASAWHRLDLPAEGLEGATLTFASTGPPARAAFLAPRLGPAACGSPDARPWGSAPPDLILFLADTFRADNLTAYGGVPETAPSLNELAARSLLFTRAWAPAAWTLPSQASMFTGLQPLQHGARWVDDAMPSELDTVAEVLRRHGYRTAAVTDSAYVSRSFGFGQGFELFHERRDWNLRETLREANEVLGADDGRPLFLFVQTYRTHVPYRTGVEEDDHAEKVLLMEFQRRVAEFGGDGSMPLEDVVPRYLDLYRQGARALDEEFGPWFAALEERGALAHGYLLFASDHGEAFFEHGLHGHGGEDWEERVRIPLFLYGPGIEARAEAQAATLLDVPRTLAGLAGVSPPPAWGGVDLLHLALDRSVRTYALLPDDVNRLTVLAGERKIHVAFDPDDLDASSLLRAYDLATDPREQQNLAEDAVEWPRRLWLDERPAVEREVVPAAAAAEAELSRKALQHLHDIGYGGD